MSAHHTLGTTAGCGPCDDRWDHCHGAWVIDASGDGRCIESCDCNVAPECHDAVVESDVRAT